MGVGCEGQPPDEVLTSALRLAGLPRKAETTPDTLEQNTGNEIRQVLRVEGWALPDESASLLGRRPPGSCKQG